MRLGFLAKKYLTMRQMCEKSFNYYGIDKSTKLNVHFSLCLYYYIVEDYDKIEEYFLKCY